ncbi:MAG: hypothetical protein IPK22_11440 [Verrucomicrobiaceae bacterium]|nr:hypothetical protein [Verrucomicrobiaceae bacterium]
MTKTEASKLQQGDRVITVNGKYTQDAQVLSVEKHHRDGYWICYRWISPTGKVCDGKKRHNSVYLKPLNEPTLPTEGAAKDS